MGSRTARAGPWERTGRQDGAGHRWGGRRGRRQMGARLAPAVRQRRRADVCDQMFARVGRGPGKNLQGSFLHPSLAVVGEGLGSQGPRSGFHGDVILCLNLGPPHPHPAPLFHPDAGRHRSLWVQPHYPGHSGSRNLLLTSGSHLCRS